MPRRPIADMIEDIDEPAEVPETSAPPAVPAAGSPPREQQEAARGGSRPRAPRSKDNVSVDSRSERPDPAASARPSARDLASPAKQNIRREALKVDVPAELALLQRLHRRRLDTGMDLRDQVAIAVDEYLTAEGY